MKPVLFAEVVKVAVEQMKGGTKLWNTFAACVATQAKAEFAAAPSEEPKGKTLRDWFKSHEEATANEKDGVKLNTIGAYRSTKSVIAAAARYGVAIVDQKGNVRGKTEVEKEIKDLRQPEAAIKTVERSITAITGKYEAVTDPVEITAMYAMTKKLFEAITAHAQKMLKAKDEKALEKKAEKLEQKAA
jgi:hypothetical protein